MQVSTSANSKREQGLPPPTPLSPFLSAVFHHPWQTVRLTGWAILLKRGIKWLLSGVDTVGKGTPSSGPVLGKGGPSLGMSHMFHQVRSEIESHT